MRRRKGGCALLLVAFATACSGGGDPGPAPAEGATEAGVASTPGFVAPGSVPVCTPSIDMIDLGTADPPYLLAARHGIDGTTLVVLDRAGAELATATCPGDLESLHRLGGRRYLLTVTSGPVVLDVAPGLLTVTPAARATAFAPAVRLANELVPGRGWVDGEGAHHELPAAVGATRVTLSPFGEHAVASFGDDERLIDLTRPAESTPIGDLWWFQYSVDGNALFTVADSETGPVLHRWNVPAGTIAWGVPLDGFAAAQAVGDNVVVLANSAVTQYDAGGRPRIVLGAFESLAPFGTRVSTGAERYLAVQELGEPEVPHDGAWSLLGTDGQLMPLAGTEAMAPQIIEPLTRALPLPGALALVEPSGDGAAVVDLTTGAVVRVELPGGLDAPVDALSLDGRFVHVAGHADAAWALVDPATGAAIPIGVATPTANVPLVSPDGAALVDIDVLAETDRFLLRSLPSGETITTLAGIDAILGWVSPVG